MSRRTVPEASSGRALALALTARVRGVAPVVERISGPAIILAGVLITMRGFLGARLISDQHPDPLTMWIPTFTYLGRALADLRIPDWNPYAFAGMPFAGDPQSGWLYLPAMAFFTTLPTGAALNALVLLNPILVGLGVFGFLRSEGIERSAATIGGLLATLPLASTRLGLSLPLIGALGWTAVLLAAVSKAMHERRPTRFVLWAFAAAICWGQVANAHLSNGLVIASGLVAVYLATVVYGERSATSGWTAWRRSLALIASFPIVNAAVLLPRLHYLGGSSISTGYANLDAISQRLTGSPTVALVGLTSTETGLSLASMPAPYIGALGFALALGWFGARRQRVLGIALLGTAALLTLSASNAFAEGVQPLIGSGRLGGFLTHEPLRFVLGEVLVLGVLGGLGAAHLADGARRSGDAAASIVTLLPGLALWALSALGQAERFRSSPLGLLALVGAGAALVVFRKQAPWILVGLVLYDLLSAGAVGSGSARFAEDPFPLRSPTVVAADFLEPSPIEGTVAEAATSGERYAPWAPDDQGLGPFAFSLPPATDWAPSGANGRGMLFGGMDVGGYNPSQPMRTWLAMRRLDPAPKRYNQSYVQQPSPALIDLLQLRWVIAEEAPDWAERTATLTDGRWSLFRVPGDGGLASFPSSVVRADGPEQALDLVAAPGFDPRAGAVWEGDPAIGVVAGAGEASATWERDDRLAIDLDVRDAGLLVVRVAWDEGWRAAMDGVELQTVPVDGFLTGVIVPAGAGRLTLAYEDPSIRLGLLISLAALGGAAVLAWAWRRKAAFEVVPRAIEVRPTGKGTTGRRGRGRTRR